MSTTRLAATILLGLAVVTVGRANTNAQYEGFTELTGEYMGQAPPGDFPIPFGDPFLKPPEGYHSSIVFSPDGAEAYWTEMVGHTYVSKLRDGSWTRPVPVLLDTLFGATEPFFSADGSRLYFLSRRPPSEGDPERERIWFVDRSGDAYTEPRVIDKLVCDYHTHWQFSLANNGNLYFTAETDPARQEQDVYMAEWRDGAFRAPVSLGDSINTDQRDMTPFIAPDESYLIFARKMPEEAGRTDLFISFRTADGVWSTARNLGDTINTLHNDLCPIVTADGEYMFFLRVSGQVNDVYWVGTGFIEEMRAKSGVGR